MRMYDKTLLGRLLEGELCEGEIVLKSIPDSQEVGVLDDRERDHIIAVEEASKNAPLPKDLEDLRALFGCENYDISEKRIITESVDVDLGHGDCRIWVYRPEEERKDRAAVLYIHGGAFFAGSAAVFHNPMKLLAEKAGCVVFNLEYTLAPELKYPGQIEECIAAIDFIENNAKEYGVDDKKICICGDSAGANIAIAVAMRVKDRLAMQILFYPVVDFICDGVLYDWREECYNIADRDRELIVPKLGTGRIDGKGDVTKMKMTAALYLKKDGERMNEDVSPLYADLEGLPKTLMFFAEYDGLRISEELFFEKLKESSVSAYGIEYLGVAHAFFEKPGILPQAEAAVIEIADMLKKL